MDTNTPRPEVGQIYVPIDGDPFKDVRLVIAEVRDNPAGTAWVKYDYIVDNTNIGPLTCKASVFNLCYTLKP
jgi:hypothetical protein